MVQPLPVHTAVAKCLLLGLQEGNSNPALGPWYMVPSMTTPPLGIGSIVKPT